MLQLTNQEIQPGDIIECKGLKVVVSKILYQNNFDNQYILEFEDTNGNYRSWKQHVDGGKIYRK